MSALAELDAAITQLRLAWELSREEADTLQREAIVTRGAHPGLLCGADLLAQMDVPEHLRPRLLEELQRVHWEGREVRDPPGQYIVRNCGYITGWKQDD